MRTHTLLFSTDFDFWQLVVVLRGRSRLYSAQQTVETRPVTRVVCCVGTRTSITQRRRRTLLALFINALAVFRFHSVLWSTRTTKHNQGVISDTQWNVSKLKGVTHTRCLRSNCLYCVQTLATVVWQTEHQPLDAIVKFLLATFDQQQCPPLMLCMCVCL